MSDKTKIVFSKSDKTKNFLFKIMLFRKIFSSKSWFLEKFSFFKIVLFKNSIFIKIVLFEIARKTQKLLILRGKLSENVIFCVQNIFQNLLAF